jgi:hypothetical protein
VKQNPFGAYKVLSKRHGFGDVASDLQSSTDPDTLAGVQALQQFWQFAQPLNAQLPTDFGSFLVLLEQAWCPVSQAAAWPGYVGSYFPTNTDAAFEAKVAGVGTQINVGGVATGFFTNFLNALSNTTPDITPITPDQVTSAMQALATQGNGQIPADYNQVTAVLQDSSTQVSFLQMVSAVAGMSTGQSAQAVQQVGQAAINVGQGALSAVNTFAQYETYFIVGGAALAAFLAYQFYVKPITSRL